MEQLRDELTRLVGLLPEIVLPDAKRYLETLLIYDDEGVLCDEAVAAVRASKTGQTRLHTNEEVRKHREARRAAQSA